MLTLAQIMERTNRLQEARRLMERLVHAIRRASSLGNDLLMTEARIAQRVGDHERTVRSCCIERSTGCRASLTIRHFALFPLAKSLDALKRYDEAFAAAGARRMHRRSSI